MNKNVGIETALEAPENWPAGVPVRLKIEHWDFSTRSAGRHQGMEWVTCTCPHGRIKMLQDFGLQSEYATWGAFAEAMRGKAMSAQLRDYDRAFRMEGAKTGNFEWHTDILVMHPEDLWFSPDHKRLLTKEGLHKDPGWRVFARLDGQFKREIESWNRCSSSGHNYSSRWEPANGAWIAFLKEAMPVDMKWEPAEDQVLVCDRCRKPKTLVMV